MKQNSFYIPITALAMAGVMLLSTKTPVLADDTRTVPETRQQIQLSYAPLVKQVAPAVVNIYTKRVVRQRVSPFAHDPFFRQFFGDGIFGGQIRERVQSSLGSGVIVEPDGRVVTNAHVIKDASEIVVVLSDGRELAATPVLIDEETDLAVLQVETEGQKLPVVDIANSDDLQVGDLVLAIGNPFGVGQTVTSGIVSALARTSVGISEYGFFIQTDAAINPGNSGGALIDMQGRLVGINSAIFSRDGGSLGIGFAIPSNMLRTVMAAADNGGVVIRPWAGLGGQTVTSDIADSLGLSRPTGVMTTDVHPQSPAGRAGVKTGDIILSINGQEVRDPQAIKFRLGTVQLGKTVTMRVLRNGEEFDVQFKAMAAPEIPPREATTVKGRNPLSGAVVGNISPAVSDELGGLPQESGVVVLKVTGGFAARMGLAVGDIVLSINGQEIKSVRDAVKATDKKARQWRLELNRGGRVVAMTVTVG